MRLEREVKDFIREVPPYVPGKSTGEISSAYGLEKEEVVKLASNENPLGPPPGALKAVREALGDSHLYPDPEARELSQALQHHLGVESEVAVGNGSDDLLEQVAKLFLRPGKEAVIAPPTFSYYGILARIYGSSIREVPLKEDGKGFSLPLEEIISSLSKKTGLIFLCSPNNPTGSTVREDEVEELLGEGKMVVMDEAYAEFADSSLAQLTENHDNLVVTKTFSKAFGLAGFRVGYCACNQELKELILRVKQPFNVSSIAQKAALAALEDKEHLRRTIELVKKGREFIIEGAKKLNLNPYPSQGNFVLIRSQKGVAERLLPYGVVVRSCFSFPGLDESYFRVSVGREEENRKFIQSLGKVLEV